MATSLPCGSERRLKRALILNDWGKKPPVLKVKKQGRQGKVKSLV